MRRFALLFLTLPLAFHAYACGDDEPADPGEVDGGVDDPTPVDPVDPGESDASGGDEDAGPTCVGNPLTADGMTPPGDAGAVLSADAGEVVRTGLSMPNAFLDGPVFTDAVGGGALVFSQVFASQIYRTGPDGGPQTLIATAPGAGMAQPYLIGNAVHGGTILTTVVPRNAAVTDPAIARTQPDGGDAGVIALPATVNDPNDLVVLKDGTIFFTDPGFQSGSDANGLYRVAQDGGVTRVKLYDTNGDRPDGIALSPDERTLYVSFGASRRIDRYTIDANGVATAGAPFPATFVDNPEGLAVDVGGNLWVAEAAPGDTNAGRVSVFDRDGKRWGEIAFPNHRPVGLAFGGADNRALYVLANRFTGGETYDGFVFIHPSRCAGVR